VLHLSDLHLDVRYVPGTEAKCKPESGKICCRLRGPGTAINVPAPIFGHHQCDSPYYLALAALQSIGPLSGAAIKEPPAFTLYTGELIAHNAKGEKSQQYVEAMESVVWQMFKIVSDFHAAPSCHANAYRQRRPPKG
jgi:hypothetical protein